MIAAGVRKDDLYIDQGASGARASRPALDAPFDALAAGDTLVVTTLDRLGRSTANMLELSSALTQRGGSLRVLNLGGSNVDTSTATGSMVFTVMAALAQMELEIRRERVLDSVAKRRAAGGNLGGRPVRITDRQVESARRLIDSGQSATQVAKDLGLSRASLYRRLQSRRLEG